MAWLGTLSPEARQPASRQGTAATTPTLRPAYRDRRPELVNITAAAGISQSTQLAMAGPQGGSQGPAAAGWVGGNGRMRDANGELRQGRRR